MRLATVDLPGNTHLAAYDMVIDVLHGLPVRVNGKPATPGMAVSRGDVISLPEVGRAAVNMSKGRERVVVPLLRLETDAP